MSASVESVLERRLFDALYVEAMLLADEARSYFDEAGRADREALDPLVRVGFSCESLKVTTRLMHIIAWLLTQRAVQAGELRPADAMDPSRQLGDAPVTAPGTIESLPLRAQELVRASIDLHRRIAWVEAAQLAPEPPTSIVRSLQARLALSF